MNAAEAGRQIAALKAIVQTMLPDHYPRGHAKDGKALFGEQLAEDELLAMAVANELSENELEHAFRWADASYGTIDNELAASPVRPHLSEEQVQRARVALLAIAEVDDAHTLAVRMPDRPEEPPLTADGVRPRNTGPRSGRPGTKVRSAELSGTTRPGRRTGGKQSRIAQQRSSGPGPNRTSETRPPPGDNPDAEGSAPEAAAIQAPASHARTSQCCANDCEKRGPGDDHHALARARWNRRRSLDRVRATQHSGIRPRAGTLRRGLERSDKGSTAGERRSRHAGELHLEKHTRGWNRGDEVRKGPLLPSYPDRKAQCTHPLHSGTTPLRAGPDRAREGE